MTIHEFAKGSKIATVQVQNGEFVACVGFTDKLDGFIPARFFKGYSTCSNAYKSESAAVKACQKFLGK